MEIKGTRSGNPGAVILMILAFTGLVVITIFSGSPSSWILFSVRIPRLVLALLTGMILGGVGAVFQAILNNPLAEPYLLGISSGAALGRVVAVVLGLYLFTPVFGFLGALATMFIVMWLAGRGGGFGSVRLILAGVITGLFCSAALSLLMYLNRNEIGGIIDILMGSLGGIFSYGSWRVFLISGAIATSGLGYLVLQSGKLEILTAGDEVAHSLGINPTSLRRQVFVIGSLLTGFSVAYAGIIGFVGLIVPHLVRMIQGVNQRSNLLASIFTGGLLLGYCDWIARNLSPLEVPVGVVTAFLGAPVFLLVFRRRG